MIATGLGAGASLVMALGRASSPHLDRHRLLPGHQLRLSHFGNPAMSAPRKTPAALTPLRGGAHDIEQRKKDHIDIILSGQARARPRLGLRRHRLRAQRPSRINFAEIDLSTTFLGKTLRIPFLASSMTGGPQLGGRINISIAEAAQELGFAMGVGSQRIALGGGVNHGLDKSIRRWRPTSPSMPI